MANRHAILPPEATARLPLVAVMAIMSYLAALSLAVALGVGRATESWSADLTGAVTVQIKPDPAMAPNEQRRAVLDLLALEPGVAATRALEDKEVRGLLEPWLGKNVAFEDLPVSQLIDVTLDKAAPPDLAALGAKIAERVPGAALDDHRTWNERLKRFAHRLSALGLAVLLLIGLATVAIVVFATRAGLSANQETVEVLHLVGAQDRFIAREFERHFLWLALRAGAIGVLTALMTLGAAGFFAAQGDVFLPEGLFALSDQIALVAVPLAAALVAMLTARLTVLNVLRALP